MTTPALKAFLIQLFLALLCSMLVVSVLIYVTKDLPSLSEEEDFTLMVGASIALVLLVNAVQEATKNWINDITGHTEPPQKQPTPQAKFWSKVMLIILFASILGDVWYLNVPQKTTSFNAFFSAIALSLSSILLFIGLFYDEFNRRYFGLALGLLLSGLFLTVPLKEDIAGIPLLLIIAIPAGIGHTICTWWNKQDFVIAARRQREADRAKAQQDAEERARDAELEAKIDALRKTPPSRQSPTPNLGPEAQKLKTDIDQLYKK